MASVLDVDSRERELAGARVAHQLENPLTALKALSSSAYAIPARPPPTGGSPLLEREFARMEEILRSTSLRAARSSRRLPRACRSHGGSLCYASEPGKGTTATATLPRSARAA